MKLEDVPNELKTGTELFYDDVKDSRGYVNIKIKMPYETRRIENGYFALYPTIKVKPLKLTNRDIKFYGSENKDVTYIEEIKRCNITKWKVISIVDKRAAKYDFVSKLVGKSIVCSYNGNELCWKPCIYCNRRLEDLTTIYDIHNEMRLRDFYMINEFEDNEYLPHQDWEKNFGNIYIHAVYQNLNS